MTDRVVLSAGRIAYALLAGLALLVVSLSASLIETVGAYTLQAGLAASVAALLPMGVDRVVARRLAAGEIDVDLPIALIKLRVLQVGLLLIAMICFSVWSQWGAVAVPCGAFVIARLLYADLETLWIASARPIRTLGLVVGLNGVITAAGLIIAAPLGAGAMVLGSSAGNLVALTILAVSGRWKIGFGPMKGLAREAAGFGTSAALAVVYSRVDLLIIAFLGVNLQSIAVYGVVTRMFDALGLIRGSIAQIESRALATETAKARYSRVLKMAARGSFATVSVSCAAALIWFLAMALPVFTAWGADKTMLFIAISAIPAYFLHLSTTALVFADRRSHILLLGSVLAASGAVGLKLVLIGGLATSGAVAAVGVCEALSFLIFVWSYREKSEPLRSVLSVSLLAIALAALPVAVARVVA